MSTQFLAYSARALTILAMVGLSGCAGANPAARVVGQGQALGGRVQTTTIDGLTVVSNEIIVRLSAPAPQLTGDLPAGRLELVYPALNIYKVELPAGQAVAEALQQWSALPQVVHADPNVVHQIDAPLVFPRKSRTLLPQLKTKVFTPQWDLTNINVPQAWNITKGSASVVVAVVDTGVDPTHPNLQATLLPMIDEYGTDNYTDSNNVVQNYTGKDGYGHGTHVSGTIAGAIDETNNIAGVAPNVKILPIKIFGALGDTTTAIYLQGLNDAVTNNVQVMNLSLGGVQETKDEQDAIDNAIGKGIAVVAAAGNNRGHVEFPGSYTGVIAVAAATRSNKVADYSDFGPELFVTAPGGGFAVDGSDGDEVNSTWPTYLTALDDQLAITTAHSTFGISGTSMATPHVAGAIALLLSNEPNLSAQQVRIRLGNAVSSMVGSSGVNRDTGYGQIDVLKLLTSTAP